MSSSAAETTLSSSPKTAPRISTSCSNMTGGDVHKVVWQHPHPQSSRTLAGAGVGWGSARRPTKGSAGRGQVLVSMLTDKSRNRGQELAAKLKGNSAGRGQSIPPHHKWEGQNKGEDRQTLILRLAFPHPSLCIWTTSILQSLTPRLPPDHLRGLLSLPTNWQSAMSTLRWQPTRKKERLLKPPLNGYGERNKRKRPLRRNGKSMSSAGFGTMMPDASWKRRELNGKKNTTVSEGPLEPVLTLLLTHWDGANMNGPGEGHMRVPHGLGTYGVPAPWTINS